MSINGQSIDGASIGGAAALDEEAYQLWLRDSSAPVAHLVEQDYNDVSAVYPNWVTHTIKSSDRADLSFTGYPDRIKSIGAFSRQIGDRFTGVVSASIGEIEYDNAHGRLDLWHKLSIDGQSVRVYHGHPDWARERFRLVYEGVSEKVSTSTSKALKIQIRSVDYKYNLPIQETLIGTAMPNPNANNPVPKAFGIFSNASPSCIDLVNQVYQFGDGASTSVSDVRDGGVSFQTPQRIISAVAGNLITTSVAHGFVANTRVRCDTGALPAIGVFWTKIIWNGHIFLAKGNSFTAAISYDGYIWTTITLPTNPASASWSTIGWNGSVFCLTATASPTNYCATSPDGTNWTVGTMPIQVGGAIAWSGTSFCSIVSIEKKTALSPDGLTWTYGGDLPSSSPSWVAVVWAGTQFFAFAPGTTTAATSPDGAVWTSRAMPSAATWSAAAWNGTVICVVAGTISSNVVATSTDGIAWTTSTMPSSATWSAIGWNGSVFVAVARGTNKAATSPDGITWTAHTLPASGDWFSIAWNGYYFCTIDYNTNTAILSADGITWSSMTNTLPTPLAINTDYWVIPDGLTSTDFKLSATRGGSVITLTSGTTGAGLVGYRWTADLATSKIYLDQKPAGVLTMDGVAGSTDASTIVVSALSAVNVDPTSQSRFQSLCAQPMGIYIKERRNRLDVASDIVNGIGAWFGHGRDGMLKFGRINGSPASYDFAIIEDDMYPETLQIEKMIPPEKKHRCSYRKNWTNQNGSLFAGVSPDNVALFSNDYSVSQPLGSTDVGTNGSFHALAVIPDVQQTLMYYAADASAENVRLDAMFFGWGAIVSVDVRRVGTLFDLGDVINVNHSRFGLGDGVTLAGGTNMEIVYIAPNPSKGRVTVKFFVAFSAYTPGQL